MSLDTSQDQIDLGTLTDAEFLALDPSKAQELMEQESQENVEQDPEQDLSEQSDSNSDDDPELVATESEPEPELPDHSKPEEITDPEPSEPVSEESETNISEENTNESQVTEEKTEKESQKIEASKEKPKAEIPASDPVVDSFYKEVTAPFKADGKTMQIRSSADAIRLMQMGVNYSKRMEELKPLRVQHEMLKQHGLDNPEKLSYLIDLSNGNPEAVQKLLKEKNIDPLEIDTSGDTNYKQSDHSPDPKDIAFKDAIENTQRHARGNYLINDINASWDDTSKEALRDNPEIFDNVLAQIDSGVYEKVKAELDYQRTMGYLTTVPFLQAYQQVGSAMEKQGVFNKAENSHSGDLAPLQSKEEPKPIDTGTRKAATKPETEQPNPSLSSNPRPVPVNENRTENETDYASMSDEDFMKLATPG